MRTDVIVIGAGPAGLTVANLLARAGIGCVLLEARTRSEIENRPQAGFIEEWAVSGLIDRGLASDRLAAAPRHGSFEFRYAGRRRVFDYEGLTGDCHIVYPQQHLVTDLVGQYVDSGGEAFFGVTEVALHELTSDSPAVTFATADGNTHRIGCDLIAGCDGARGVCRSSLPATSVRSTYDYGVGWLALLAEAPPSAGGVLFGIHPSGFAAHMSRTATVTRFYLQTRPDEVVTDWPDDRVWTELESRLSVEEAPINQGRLIEKRLLSLHNYVVEPMSYGRLHLAGDAAHLVAPIAAKGMNLALHDAFLLAGAIAADRAGNPSLLSAYSAACLPLVWQYQEFSVWLSDIFHRSADTGNGFLARTAEARLQRLLESPAAATAFAEIYIGKHNRV